MRIDKTSAEIGVHRAPLDANWTADDAAIGVGLNITGEVVVGSGNTGIIGVVLRVDDIHGAAKAGDIVDIFNHAEIVEFGGAAGTVYTANTTTGVISSAAKSATQVPIGFTIEAGRLVVHVSLGHFDAVV